MYSPFAHLAFWHAAASSSADPPDVYPFAPPGSEANDTAARHLAAQLQAREPEARQELLAVLHGRSALLPWLSLHPSWLEDILADAPEAWRGWALAVLPATLRPPLLKDKASPGDTPPPPWWPAWFTGHVKQRLGYPDPPPWPTSPDPPGSLRDVDEATLHGLLRIWGTRGLLSALRTRPRAEAQQWLWALPSDCRPVADQTVQERRLSEDPFWAEVFTALASDPSVAEACLTRLALADLMRAGGQLRQEIELRRLAFRLPRELGGWMLVELAARPGWLDHPVQPSLEAWRESLQSDLHRAAAPHGAPQ